MLRGAIPSSSSPAGPPPAATSTGRTSRSGRRAAPAAAARPPSNVSPGSGPSAVARPGRGRRVVARSRAAASAAGRPRSPAARPCGSRRTSSAVSSVRRTCCWLRLDLVAAPPAPPARPPALRLDHHASPRRSARRTSAPSPGRARRPASAFVEQQVADRARVAAPVDRLQLAERLGDDDRRRRRARAPPRSSSRSAGCGPRLPNSSRMSVTGSPSVAIRWCEQQRPEERRQRPQQRQVLLGQAPVDGRRLARAAPPKSGPASSAEVMRRTRRVVEEAQPVLHVEHDRGAHLAVDAGRAPRAARRAWRAGERARRPSRSGASSSA